MYRGTSPIFDVPEFPPLRRVKPLPKRRRTSTDATSPILDGSQYTPVSSMIPSGAPVDMTSFGLNMPLPPYYMPMFNGMQDMFRAAGSEDRPLEFPSGFAVPVGTAEDDDHGDGDYVDHLQQPGNTKKRKVPAAHHSTTDSTLSPAALEDEETGERSYAIPIPGPEEAEPVLATGSSPYPTFPMVRNRTTAITLAGLQLKELLKTRKRQLAAVLGALSHGDTLALDQALSANYSNVTQPKSDEEDDPEEPEDQPRRRSDKHKASDRELLRSPDPPEGVASGFTFTFACPSPTSERLVSTREEVAVLHSRFEAELSRQATAAEVAKQNAQAAAESGPVTKRGTTQQRSRTAGALVEPNSNNGLDSASGTGAKGRTSKKKKRSALANASNPHHLRNYVPSRIPHSGLPPATQSVGNVQNLVSPPPMRFLTAEIAPRRRKKTTPTPVAPLNQPEDEWICAFCEYNLFYGEDAAFRRAVRSRKKILNRRRRARERAAAAASGQKNTVAPVDTTTTTDSFDSHVEDEYAAGDMESNGPGKRPSASKRDRPGDKQGL